MVGQATRRAALVHVRDDQIASINPALIQAQQAVARGDLDAVYSIYVLDDETVADTRPSLCRLHYLLFRLWRLGERIRAQGSRLEFRQGELGTQLKQYAAEVGAAKVYTTSDDSHLGLRQTERIRRGITPLELVVVPAREGIMNEEYEPFAPYWELFSEDELELMQL